MKKVIEINNYDDPSELKKVITKLQLRRKNILRNLGYDQIHFNGSKYNLDNIMPVFDEILNFPLPESDEGPRNFYVYFHCNPMAPFHIKNDLKHLFLAKNFPKLKSIPFYVGKGQGRRYLDFQRNDSHRKIRSKLLEVKLEIEPVIIKDNMTESQALNLESKLIDILGLRHLDHHGMLVNLDEGTDHSHRRKILYANSTNYEKIQRILIRNKLIS